MEAKYAVPYRRRQEALQARRRGLSHELVERLGAAAADAAGRFPSIRRVTVFGSAAEGRATETSDVDVLVDGLVPDDYYPLRRFLSERLGREADLHTDSEPGGFVSRVRVRGRCVYDRGL